MFHVQTVSWNCIAWAHADPTVIRYLSYCQSPVIANNCSNFSNHFLVSRCWRSSRAEVAFNGGSVLFKSTEPNTCVRPIAFSPYDCCNNWYVSVAGFPILKQNLMQMRSILSHIVKIAMTNARVTSATYYSQLSKRSHLQLVSWVAKTCTNMSRLVANTSYPVNNHYNSNPDTFWTNLVYRIFPRCLTFSLYS